MPLSFSEIDNLANSGRIANIDGGRVTTLLPDNYGSARSVRILEEPDAGRLTVNPDNSLALVMTGENFTGRLSFRVEVVNANGSTSRDTIELRVNAPSQSAGWGLGQDQYMLETDSNGDLVLETGQNHREVYVSGDRDALTIADIAAREGISRSAINGEWLEANPEYGATANMALAQDAGALLWIQLTRSDRAEPGSHWLRLEKGHSYDGFDLAGGDLFPHGMSGEDPLHPLVITSYGQGAQPIISTDQSMIRDKFANIVIHDIHFTEEILLLGPLGTDSKNIIFDTVTFSEQGGVSAQQMEGFTVRNATFANVGADQPSGGGNWSPNVDRDYAIYSANTSGVLIEDSTFVQIGWGDGYAANGSGDRPQAPSMFTHNVYMNDSVRDMTFRDNISAEGASYGANLRSGGFVEDNLFFENNGGVVVSGGDWNGSGQVGNFSLLSGNVVTSAGYHEADGPGVLARGISNDAADTTLVNNIVAHQTDPSALGSQYSSNWGLFENFDPAYNDTIIYNWYGQYAIDADWIDLDDLQQNIDGVNLSRADQTTITNLARSMMNDSRADANDFADWLVENDVPADQLNAYFQRGFNAALPSRSGATDVRFTPTEISDGVRWDNRENWSTGDVAGTYGADRVDLGGNWVVYGGTTTIRSLDFGDGGHLEAGMGHLNITGTSNASGGRADLTLDESGQVWMGGGWSGGVLDVDMDGGRFANTGVVNGNVNLFVDGGQALLSANGGDFILGAGETLTVRGGDTQAGFDGTGNREGIISFNTNSEIVLASDSSGIGRIGEFASGAYSSSPRVDSNIHLGGADLTVDMRSARLSTGTYTLMSADDLTGTLENFSIQNLGSRSATLTVNYVTDQVLLNIASGSGVRTETIGSGGSAPDVDTSPPPAEEPEDNTPPQDNTPAPSPPSGNTPPVGETDSSILNLAGFERVSQIDALVNDIGGVQGLDDLPNSYKSNYTNEVTFNDSRNSTNGTGQNDLFFARGGNDSIRGSAGNDMLDGGSGNDWLRGDDGADVLWGGWGEDELLGGGGNDILLGGDQSDDLMGNQGDDILNGGQGRDVINGGTGDDILYGGARASDGDIFIFDPYGRDGNDIIADFNVGVDMIVYGSRDDNVRGFDRVTVSEYRGDAVLTFDGLDTSNILLRDVSVAQVQANAANILGDMADARLETTPGGSGSSSPPQQNTPAPTPPPSGPSDASGILNLAGFERVSQIDALVNDIGGVQGLDDLPNSYKSNYTNEVTFNDSRNSTNGTGQNDLFFARGGNDSIRGNDGNDMLDGGSGNDWLRGDDGADVLWGGWGEDELLGGGGNDILLGGDQSDDLMGNQGDDILNGGQGRDVINGGTGDDILYGGARASDGDIFIFDPYGRDGNDIIADFNVGVDMIVYGSRDDNVRGFDRVTVSEYRGDAVLTFDGLDTSNILLRDVSVAQVQANAANILGDMADARLETTPGGSGSSSPPQQNTPAPTPPPSGPSDASGILNLAGFERVSQIDALVNDIGGVQGLDDLPNSYKSNYTNEVTFNDSRNSTNGTGQNDLFFARGGNDSIRGNDGNDMLDGGSGNDWLRGDDGADILWGGWGEDELIGSGGNDILLGGGQSDNLMGNQGDDILSGGQGRDQLNGGSGDDILYGGARTSDTDVFVFDPYGRDGNDIIADFNVGVDIIVFGNRDDNVRGFDRVTVSEYRGDAVLTFDGLGTSNVLLKDVSVAQVEANADSILGDMSDWMYV